MSIKLEVWGDYALFTRPEMKTERVSYDVMTPSAARGILEAIFWHPGMMWVIDAIHVCNPIRFINIRRNELGQKGSKLEYYDGSIEQRSSVILRDVRYVISAHFEMTDKAVPSDNPGKFCAMFKRRVEKGAYFHQPYFGTREFPVYFSLCEEIPPCPDELKGHRDLGFMLFDLDYSDPKNITPLFFKASLENGRMTVPDRHSEEVIG